MSFSAVHEWWQVRGCLVCVLSLSQKCWLSLGVYMSQSHLCYARDVSCLHGLSLVAFMQGVRLSLHQAELDLGNRQQQMVAVEVSLL